MRTAHKARKRDLCQCEKPQPVKVGMDLHYLVGDYCKRCMKEIDK